MAQKGSFQQFSFLSAIIIMVVILFMIVYSENGFNDWLYLKHEVQSIENANKKLDLANRELARTIERLKTDIGYIEHVARHELGMAGKNELVFRFKD